MCVNYRTFNSYTIKNEAGLPRSDEIFDQIKALKSLANWTYVLDIIRSELMMMTLRKPLLDVVMGIMNF